MITNALTIMKYLSRTLLITICMHAALSATSAPAEKNISEELLRQYNMVVLLLRNAPTFKPSLQVAATEITRLLHAAGDTDRAWNIARLVRLLAQPASENPTPLSTVPSSVPQVSESVPVPSSALPSIIPADQPAPEFDLPQLEFPRELVDGYKQAERLAKKINNKTTTPEKKIECQLILGGMYLHAEGVFIDYDLAVKHLDAVAKQELIPTARASAQLMLGELYRYGGEGVPRDYRRAVLDYLIPAAGQNDDLFAKASAQWILGEMYFDGLGVNANPGYAWVTYLRPVAAQTVNLQAQAYALSKLGHMYVDGLGFLSADHRYARHYLDRAAKVIFNNNPLVGNAEENSSSALPVVQNEPEKLGTYATYTFNVLVNGLIDEYVESHSTKRSSTDEAEETEDEQEKESAKRAKKADEQE